MRAATLEQYGDDAELELTELPEPSVRAGHVGFVNVWRPVGNPINSAPLGFVRPRSVADEDWLTIKLIYPDRLGSIMGLVANDAHEWVYLSKMTPDEVAIFNIHDNRGRPSIS